jgi:perosamine synthetase
MTRPSIIINKINYFNILKDIISKDEFINLKEIFIQKFSELSEVNSKKIILLGRARSAIYLSVKLSILKKKNKIILMSPFTVPEVIKLVIHAGGVPYFIDFHHETTFLNLDEIENGLRLKPAAIIITHYNLSQIHYSEVSEICKKHDIDLIEDSALSISGKVKKNNINSLSDYSLFSFSSFKLLNFFFGGAIAVQYDKYEDIKNLTIDWKILKLRDYLNQIYRTILFSVSTNSLLFKILTINLLKIYNNKNNVDILDNKLAKSKYLIEDNYFSLPAGYAISELNRKIPLYKNNRVHRKKISEKYFDSLQEITVGSDFKIQDLIMNGDNFNYLIKCKNKIHRDNLRKKLLLKNYLCGKLFYKNCHKLQEFRHINGNSKNVSDLNDKILILPTHQNINEDYADNLINQIKKDY